MESKYNVGDKVRLLVECDDLDAGDMITLLKIDETYWECADTNGHLFIFNEKAFEPIKDELVVDNKNNNDIKPLDAQEIRDKLLLNASSLSNETKDKTVYIDFNKDKEVVNNWIDNNYYGGKDNPYEAIKIINNFDLNFNRGNVFKYILRAGKKDADKEIQDLIKAKNYIDYEIERLKIMNNK